VTGTPDHLRIERQPDLLAVEIADPAASPGRRGGDDVVDATDPAGERSDRRVIGQVDDIGPDRLLPGVGLLERRPPPARDDHVGARVPRGDRDATGDAAPPTDHEHGPVLQ
jgi:hypothetical protein